MERSLTRPGAPSLSQPTGPSSAGLDASLADAPAPVMAPPPEPPYFHLLTDVLERMRAQAARGASALEQFHGCSDLNFALASYRDQHVVPAVRECLVRMQKDLPESGLVAVKFDRDLVNLDGGVRVETAKVSLGLRESAEEDEIYWNDVFDFGDPLSDHPRFDDLQVLGRYLVGSGKKTYQVNLDESEG